MPKQAEKGWKYRKQEEHSEEASHEQNQGAESRKEEILLGNE